MEPLAVRKLLPLQQLQTELISILLKFTQIPSFHGTRELHPPNMFKLVNAYMASDNQLHNSYETLNSTIFKGVKRNSHAICVAPMQRMETQHVQAVCGCFYMFLCHSVIMLRFPRALGFSTLHALGLAAERILRGDS